jgi:dipeptidyl aminopeptidase/acylaminoacyl peptidase
MERGNRMKHLLAACVILVLSSQAISAQQLMDFDALYGFDQVKDIRLSPTGHRLAYALTHNNLEKHSRSTTIQMLDLQSGEAFQLSTGGEGAAAPRWLPDGRRLAYNSHGTAGSQFWIVDPDSGQSRQITRLSGGAGSGVWFPDGRRFLFSSSVYPDCPDDECNRLRDSVAEHNPVQAKLYDHLLFRHYSSWDDGKKSHLFLGATDTETVIDLTPGANNVPPIAGGGSPAYAISPDGSEICFAMSTDPVPAVSCNNDLYIVPAAGGEPIPITANPGNDGSPMYSPDGKYIAYYEMVRPGYESEQRDIVLYNRADSTRTNLTVDFDRSVFEMIFSPDSKHIYFAAPDLGFINICHVAVKGSDVEEVVGGAVHGDLAISPDGKTLYFTRSTSTQPGEIFSYHLRQKELTRLTFHTQELADRIAMRPSEEFWFYSVDSLPIQGFLTHPPDFDPTKKYPLALLIHGGPQWCWLNDFNYYGWNIHLLAAQGYVVAQINPRGSRGYGREFCDAVSGDWGGKDYQDLMIGVDYLADRFNYIDTARMAALGRSYGGFMANWICGHTDRFKCLISIDGTFEQVSDYYSTEELWFPEWEFNGTPWTNRDLYLDRSPERFVANFKTPTLVIHGQYDYRVDLSQGLMMFTALQRRGVPSQLLYFPDEGHSVGKLRNLRHVYEVQLAWLAKYLKE